MVVKVKEEKNAETTRRTDLWRSNNTCVVSFIFLNVFRIGAEQKKKLKKIKH